MLSENAIEEVSVEATDTAEVIADIPLEQVITPEMLETLSQIDFGSAAGVAAITMIVMQVIKTQVYKRKWPSYGLLINLTNLGVAIGIGFLSMYVVDITVETAFSNGVVAGLGSMFGFEIVNNFVKSLTAKKT